MELDEDPKFVRHMELSQLREGSVMSADDALALTELFDDYGKEVEAAGEAYDEGLKAGRLEAGGAQVSELLARIDDLSSKLRVQKALTRFYSALALPPEPSDPSGRAPTREDGQDRDDQNEPRSGI